MEIKDKIINEIKKIYDPELPVNIYELGLIYDIKIEGKKAKIKMTLGREPEGDEGLTFKQSAKNLKRSKQPMTPEGVEDLSQKGLETMQSLREEIAPRWAPTQQPWLLNQADNEVYHTCLASVPKELFESTEAFQGMQQLRRGEAAFSARAADATTEALGKKS